MWQLFFEMPKITGVSSSQNCLIVLLLLFKRGGLYILPIIIFSQNDSQLTSMNSPSQSSESSCTLLIR